MPTILSHPAVPVAVAIGLGRRVIPKPLLLVGIAASMLPDLDILAFRLGIPYAADFGHRGFSHSLLFAALVAGLGAYLFRLPGARHWTAFGFLFVATASHGALDALTSGGLGVAFLWPWSGERYFAPFRPVRVAPIGLVPFLSSRGLAVLESELLWIWAPFMAAAATAVAARMYRSSGRRCL